MENNVTANAPEKKSKKKLVAILAVVAVLVLGIIGVTVIGGIIAIFAFGGGHDNTGDGYYDETTTAVPETTEAFVEETEVFEAESEAFEEEEEEKDEKKIIRGTVTDDSYENSSIGLYFYPDSGWEFYSDAEVAASLELSEGIMDPDAFEIALNTELIVPDMIAVDQASGSNVNINFENLELTGNLDCTPEDYFKAVDEHYSTLSNMTVTRLADIEYVEIGGYRYAKSVYELSANGNTMEMAQYVRKTGKHMICLTISTMADSLDAIEGLFD